MEKRSEDDKIITQAGYCYCPECNSIRYLKELEQRDGGLRCRACGSAELTPPGWVCCPQIGLLSVNCPAAGLGIVNEKTRTYCSLYCSFRN